MKKPLGLTLVVVLVAALVWRVTRPAAEHPRSPETALSQTVAAKERVVPAAVDSNVEGPSVRSPVEAPEPTAASVPVESSGESESAPHIDRSATRTLVIRVLDEFGNPLPNAEVDAVGLRSVKNSGDWIGWPGTAPQLTTDSDGRAVLEIPAWLTGFDNSWRELSDLCLSISHPEYISADIEVEIAEGEWVVALERGAFVIVSGWIDGVDERVVALEIDVSRGANVVSEDWVPLRGRRPSCNKIRPGSHSMRIEHVRGETKYASLGVDFEIAPGEEKELHIELLPTRTVRGVLDEVVPRPVLDGEVELACFHRGTSGSVLLPTQRHPVAPDGSFEFARIPVGPAEITAICSGFVSRRFPPQDPDTARWHEENPLVAFASEERFTIEMEPAARLEVSVFDPDGFPLEGAVVMSWPNVFWRVGSSNMFVGRECKQTTDARGIAILEDLEPGLAESVTVRHPDFALPLAESRWDQERRNVWGDFVGGETTRITVQVEASEK